MPSQSRLPDLEWTLDTAPDEATVSRPGVPGSPRRLGPRWLPRRWLWAGLAGAVVLAAAAGAFVHTGWRRLRQQVEAEILYEEAQSRARAVQAVSALQAGLSPQWIARRSAEAALGLPAPQPAANLIPTDDPPRILSFGSAEPGVFVATVLRAYADAAGQTYEFELAQRYRNLGPGLWERLPPDESALVPAEYWRGERLLAGVPALDLPTLAPLLPSVDAAIVQACADWKCPSRLVVPLVFTGRVAELPGPGFAPRQAPGAHPMAFDLAVSPRRDPRRLVVAAPSLAGRPRDEAAGAALARALSAAALAFVADELAGSARRPADYYLDALIAREEIRLGLSPVVTPALSARDYAAPEALWNVTTAPEASPEAELARRWQALAYLNFVLGDRPPALDGGLLGTLRRRTSLDAWLGLEPSTSGAAVRDAWRDRLAAEFERQSALPASALDGLAYQCGDGTWLYRGSRPHQLPVSGSPPVLDPGGLSPDGRYLAAIAWTVDGFQRLDLFDLAAGTRQAIEAGPSLALVGWSADSGLLVYARRPPEAGEAGMGLWGLRPGAKPRLLLAASVYPDWGVLRPQWSADRTLLAVTLVDDRGVLRPAMLRLAGGVSVQPLTPDAGYGPAIAADGSVAAYALTNGAGPVAWRSLGSSMPGAAGVLSRQDLAVDGVLPSAFSLLHWSPDGQVLAFVAAGEGYGAHLFLFERAGGGLTRVSGGRAHYLLPLQFSTDGRFHGYLENMGTEAHVWVVVRDMASGVETRRAFDFGHLRRIQTGPHQPISSGAAAWSPSGHLLAVSTPSGVFVIDPATGDVRWVTLEACGRVVWW